METHLIHISILFFFFKLSKDLLHIEIETRLMCVNQISRRPWRHPLGLTVCWMPGWCPRVSASRPVRGHVSLDCWPETEWEWKLCRKLNWERQRHCGQEGEFKVTNHVAGSCWRMLRTEMKLTQTPPWPQDICTEPCWTGRCLRTVALQRHTQRLSVTHLLQVNACVCVCVRAHAVTYLRSSSSSPSCSCCWWRGRWHWSAPRDNKSERQQAEKHGTVHQWHHWSMIRMWADISQSASLRSVDPWLCGRSSNEPMGVKVMNDSVKSENTQK